MEIDNEIIGPGDSPELFLDPVPYTPMVSGTTEMQPEPEENSDAEMTPMNHAGSFSPSPSQSVVNPSNPVEEMSEELYTQLMIHMFDNLLSTMIQASAGNTIARATVFDSHAVPEISISVYLGRILQYGKTPSLHIVTALKYID
jgi:hypothetical protein